MSADRASRMFDSHLGYVSINGARCNRCRFVADDGRDCRAFPQGIPIAILSGKFDHSKPYRGDHGIRFEARE